MITTFVISFRESLEVFLILVPLFIYTVKNKDYTNTRVIIYGFVLGLMSTIAASILLFNQLDTLEGLGKRIFDGGINIFLSMLILLNIIQFIKQKKLLTGELRSGENNSLPKMTLFILSYITVFRESLEIIVYSIPSMTGETAHIITGAILGVLGSFILCLLVFILSVNLNMKVVFFILTVLMIIIGADMFGEGVANLLPEGEESLETAGRLMYAIPLLYIFIKKELKELLNKK